MTKVRRISDALKIRATHQRDEIAHDDTRRTITFAQWDLEADEIGGGLAASGLQPGDRVFLPISNAFAVEMAIAVFAIFRAGGIVCPINPRLSPAEVSDYKNLCEPRWCITDVPDLVKNLKFDGCWSVDQMPRDISALPDQNSLDAHADAEILGTSGTTGKIKGVVVSHPDLISRGVTGTNMDSTRSTLHALPLTGSAGNLGIVMLPVRGGATAITQRKFDPKGFLELVKEKQPDLVYLVPSMLRLILDHTDAECYDFAGVKYLMTGTAPLPHDSVVRAMANWPHLKIRNNYGMSEGGVVVGTTSAAQALKPGCVGKMPEYMQLRADDGKVITETGVIGEIFGIQKHPRRYWNDPEATAASFVGGWTKTGDLGFVDGDGDLIISGRSKELIIRGGYNITPLEIETVLYQHPAVQQAAVVGVDHPVLGEDVSAAVSLRPGCSADPEEISAFCKEHLADNKVPRILLIMEALPLNPTGKIVKKDLKPLLQLAADSNRTARST
ncbi:class I adenylate-forming enzyme family protein [Sphingorhabdus contaminans]|uniref:Acyl--CoA ligase n=1 Tax=Sphingorhabdus contaminans TaxID=1343899 RepID=A0A553WCB3_9SPHN|nr:class I adenylate-forming enzyme family protein [Sphingorhabdus contaminans]TSB02339.1 acyl--CoA ligase [Sphingorhabdus contaminans]